MLRILLSIWLLFIASAPALAARVVAKCPNTTVMWPVGETSGEAVIDVFGNVCSSVADLYPTGAVPMAASAVGTVAATTATLGAAPTTTTFICGLAIRTCASAASVTNATVTGTIGSPLNFTQLTGTCANLLSTNEQRFLPCIPASAANTPIVVTSGAPGAGGTVSVTTWGFRK